MLKRIKKLFTPLFFLHLLNIHRKLGSRPKRGDQKLFKATHYIHENYFHIILEEYLQCLEIDVFIAGHIVTGTPDTRPLSWGPLMVVPMSFSRVTTLLLTIMAVRDCFAFACLMTFDIAIKAKVSSVLCFSSKTLLD